MVDQLFCRFLTKPAVSISKKAEEFNKIGLHLKGAVNTYNIYSKIKKLTKKCLIDVVINVNRKLMLILIINVNIQIVVNVNN